MRIESLILPEPGLCFVNFRMYPYKMRIERSGVVSFYGECSKYFRMYPYKMRIESSLMRAI